MLNICDQAEQAVQSGKVLICLDRHIDQGLLPVPAAMATGAVHHRLIGKGLRSECNIIVETASARDSPVCRADRVWCHRRLPLSGLRNHQ